MKTILFALTISLLPLTAKASNDSGRSFGLYLGGGLSRSFAKIEQPSVNAKLNGWGNHADLGLDLPLSDNFGFSPSVEIGQSELLNTFKSDTYLDQSTLKSTSIRGAFFYKGFELGGSYKMIDVKLKTVSATNGASSADVSGTGSSAFAGYSFNYRGVFRSSVEAEMTSFSANNFKYSDTTIGIRLYLLLGGLLGRN